MAGRVPAWLVWTPHTHLGRLRCAVGRREPTHCLRWCPRQMRTHALAHSHIIHRLCLHLCLYPPPPTHTLTQELDHPEFGHYFVKRALATALDKHDREREMTSVLLSTLYNEVGAGGGTVRYCRVGVGGYPPPH